MTDYYLTGHDADDVNSYLIADGDDWVVPPSLPGATDRVAIAGMRTGTLNVAAVLGYSGNFNPAPNLDSPASISGGTVTASSAPLGLLIGNSSGHTHATVTINGDVGGNIEVTDGHVEVSSVDGDVSAHADASVTAASVTGSVSAGGGGRVDVLGDIDASDGSVAATQGTVTAVGDIVTQGFTTGDGGMIQAGSISGDGSTTMMNYLDGGEVIIDAYNVGSPTNSSSRLDILEGAQMTVHQTFCSGRLAGDSDAVNVNGTGSALQLAGKLSVGDLGQGGFTIGNHALVFGLVGLNLGDQKSGRGTMSIDGEGSELDLTGSLVVGNRGQGSLTISKGGVVGGLDDLALGVQRSGTGTVSIDGEGSGFPDFMGNVIVGDRGHGSLSISHHAQLSLNDITVGKQQSGHGDIILGSGAELSVGHTLTLGVKGKSALSISESKADLNELILGVSAGGDGAVDIGTGGKLKVWNATIGENGSGVINVQGAASFEGNKVTIGGNGKLVVESIGEASLKHVTTIEDNGVLSVHGTLASTILYRADISGRMSVTDGGILKVNSTIVGDGEMMIGKDSSLILHGPDHGVDIRFAASGKTAELVLFHANLLDHVLIKGFAKGNEIRFDDLANQDAVISVARKGSNTAVTIRDDDGDKVGVLTLAGHYARSALDFDHGSLTTDGPSKAAAHIGSASATTHDDFLFSNQVANNSVNDGASVEYGAGDAERNHMHAVHDYGW